MNGVPGKNLPATPVKATNSGPMSRVSPVTKTRVRQEKRRVAMMKLRFRTMTAALCLLPLISACSSGGGGDNTVASATASDTTAIKEQAVGTTPQPLTGFDAWVQRQYADTLSPINIASTNLSQSWTGANGKIADVVVQLPKTAGKATVAVSPPTAGADATPVLEAALLKLRTQGGGVLQVAPGEYHFKTLNKIDRPGIVHVMLSRLNDVDIQGTGATFIFEAKVDGFLIQDCNRLRIKGITMRDAQTLSGTGRMHVTPNGTTLQLDNPLPPGATINWVQPMNEGSHTWPLSKVRAIFNLGMAQPTDLGNRTYASSWFAPFADNQFVSIRYTYYTSRSIYIRDDVGVNNDIVLDGVHLGTSGGLAVLVRSRGRGFAIVNSTIAADPGQVFSSNYDGIHFVSAAGDVLIRNNKISHVGDDQINVRSLVHKVTNITTDGATLSNEARLISAGDEVAFFDANGVYIGKRFISAIVDSKSTDIRSYTFAPGVSIAQAAYARDMQMTPRRVAVVGNTMVDSAGRGVLIQVPNALVQNNTIRVPNTAIRLFTSYQQWQEGAGAINVRISGNTIDTGGAELGHPYQFGIITASGEVATNQVATTFQNGPVVIENNRFTAPTTSCIMLYATMTATQTGNTCGS